MKAAKTIVLVQRVSDFLDVFAQWMRDAGYRVRVCTGTSDTRYDCWAHEFDDCPLWQQADLVIYDPWIATAYNGQETFALQRRRHPRMPVLLWGPGAVPADVAAMVEPGQVELLPLEVTREQVIQAVRRMIGPAEIAPLTVTPPKAVAAL